MKRTRLTNDDCVNIALIHSVTLGLFVWGGHFQYKTMWGRKRTENNNAGHSSSSFIFIGELGNSIREASECIGRENKNI